MHCFMKALLLDMSARVFTLVRDKALRGLQKYYKDHFRLKWESIACKAGFNTESSSPHFRGWCVFGYIAWKTNEPRKTAAPENSTVSSSRGRNTE